MEDGCSELLAKPLTIAAFKKYIKDQDKEVRYSYKAIKNSDKITEQDLDTITIEVLNIPDEVVKEVNYDSFYKLSGKKAMKFASDYAYMFLLVMIENLLNHNTVILGRKIIGFSLNTSKKRKVTENKIYDYNTLRTYVHISKELHKKTKLFYYAHNYVPFSRKIKRIRKQVEYTRYPDNYLT